MGFPTIRPRRLRASAGLRTLVRETRLDVGDLIYPLFVVCGSGVKEEIASLPGNYHYSVDRLAEVIQEVVALGIPGVLLFGLPAEKDETATGAWHADGVVQQAIREIKRLAPQLVVVTDVCLCQYTPSGHCGIVKDGVIQNDPTLAVIAKIALSHAQAGADLVAPSDMMDGRIGAIRAALDKEGLINTGIMSYAAKYSSAYYGPFRDAAGSAPQFGDRKTYQMDPANALEALREAALDVEEGADIVMVKPGLAYLDILWRVKQASPLPVAVYNVSAEYAMVKAAAAQGWLNERSLVMETMYGFKRAGADMIITYHAKDVARWLREG
ncbi:MAG TPA: porphobilinogen synthase [Firmicutes bacterium]|nr:porphobilinogen synthase [Bacillota bacterium]